MHSNSKKICQVAKKLLISKVFPNLRVLEICNFSSFNRNIVEILLDLLPGLKKLKEFYISFKSSHKRQTHLRLLM